MTGPFIVGASMASENILALLQKRKEYNINAAMLQNAPIKGDSQYTMTRTHGANWVAWQEVWLNGLRGLHKRTVYVISNTEPFFKKFQLNPDNDTNKKICFDPGYELEGSRARCILDWERKQIVKHAADNQLKIQHLRWWSETYTAYEAEKQIWYKDEPTKEDFTTGYAGQNGIQIKVPIEEVTFEEPDRR